MSEETKEIKLKVFGLRDPLSLNTLFYVGISNRQHVYLLNRDQVSTNEEISLEDAQQINFSDLLNQKKLPLIFDNLDFKRSIPFQIFQIEDQTPYATLVDFAFNLSKESKMSSYSRLIYAIYANFNPFWLVTKLKITIGISDFVKQYLTDLFYKNPNETFALPVYVHSSINLIKIDMVETKKQIREKNAYRNSFVFDCCHEFFNQKFRLVETEISNFFDQFPLYSQSESLSIKNWFIFNFLVYLIQSVKLSYYHKVQTLFFSLNFQKPFLINPSHLPKIQSVLQIQKPLTEDEANLLIFNDLYQRKREVEILKKQRPFHTFRKSTLNKT